MRCKRLRQIPIFEVVVGDVVCLKSADQVPSHGLLFDGPNSLQLELNEAKYDPELGDEGIELNNLTGPGVGDQDIELNNLAGHDTFVFSGTKVVDGFAHMFVTSVGMDAKGAQRTSKTNGGSGKETPLQLESQLKELNWITDRAGCAFSFTVFVIILGGGFSFFDENQEPLHGIAKINAIVGGVLVGIITTVINIPDPWQLFLTFTQAYAMKRLATTKNAMVLKPSSLETLGCANIICIDKTGVLTENKMQVDEFWLGKESMVKGTYLSSISPYVVELLRERIALNTTASMYNTANLGSKFEISGSPTEKAILLWAIEELKLDQEEAKRSRDILHSEVFSSERKQSWILVKRKVLNTMQMHCKGAAD